MLGNRTRLALDGREKIEFKKSLMLMLFGSKIPVMVYIFKQGTSNDEFIDKKPVIYILNGQTQGMEPRTFISQEIGFRNLKDYMLVSVDCSHIGTTARQELFMASRDRLKKGRYYNELRNDIISLLKNDPDISQKDQEYKGKTFKESKKDKDMIESYFSRFKSNLDVRKILSGNNGSFSFYNKKVSAGRKQNNNRNDNKQKVEKKLQRYPSIFKVKGFDADSKEYVKAIKKGGKGRIILETDAENDFLTRSSDNGSIEITTLDYGDRGGRGDHFVLPNQDAQKLKVQIAGPYDGEIRVIVEPKESTEVGERIPLSIKMISSVGEQEVIVFIRVEELKRRGFSNAAMCQWTFENDNGKCPQMDKAFFYAAHWEEMKAENIGYLLWGKVGTGKSYFAGCIANALMEREVSVCMTNFALILNDLAASYKDRNEYIARLCSFPLLILDDFGMERGTEYGLEQVYNVVDSRYRSRKPLIVTTNLTLEELQHPEDTAHARIYDRLLEMCCPVFFTGENIRKATAQGKMERLKGLMNGKESL